MSFFDFFRREVRFGRVSRREKNFRPSRPRSALLVFSLNEKSMNPYEKMTLRLKEALKSGRTAERDTLRSLLAAVKNRAIALGKDPADLTEEEVLKVLASAKKQRLESAAAYDRGGRAEAAAKERAEAEIISAYLPAQMTEEEIDAVVAEYLQRNPAGKSEMGRVMGDLMKEYSGRIDGAVLKKAVLAKLR